MIRRILRFNPKAFIITEFTLLLLIALLSHLLIHAIIIPCLLIHNTINLDSIYNQLSFPVDTILFLLTILLEDSVHLLKIRNNRAP